MIKLNYKKEIEIMKEREIMIKLFDSLSDFFNKLDFIDYHFDIDENSIHIHIHERYSIIRLRIIKRNEFIIIEKESLNDKDYHELFMISDILLKNLESNLLIYEFFYEYFYKFYDINIFDLI